MLWSTIVEVQGICFSQIKATMNSQIAWKTLIFTLFQTSIKFTSNSIFKYFEKKVKFIPNKTIPERKTYVISSDNIRKKCYEISWMHHWWKSYKNTKCDPYLFKNQYGSLFSWSCLEFVEAIHSIDCIKELLDQNSWIIQTTCGNNSETITDHFKYFQY